MKTLIIKTLLKVAAFYNGLETDVVTIKTANGPVRINKADYNEKEHTLYKPSAKEIKAQDQQFTKEQIGERAPNAPAAQPQPSEIKSSADVPSRQVMKNGKTGKASKWIVVNSNGTPVDEKEYNSEKEAWEAAMSQAQPTNAELDVNSINNPDA